MVFRILLVLEFRILFLNKCGFDLNIYETIRHTESVTHKYEMESFKKKLKN